MTVRLRSLPDGLQARVVEQRYFVQALSMALTGHDQRSMAEQAQELRAVAANAMLALDDTRYRAGESDWHDSARIAAIQSLAAAAGASLLDRAGSALRRGEGERQRFVAQTRQDLARAQSPARQPDAPTPRAGAASQTLATTALAASSTSAPGA